ncbi:hypothetical protein KAS41_02045 [Candidatus Parcubacteria bacterium]|nr:hypothetical protein [Candidatus Parcubacteria bacterium]
MKKTECLEELLGHLQNYPKHDYSAEKHEKWVLEVRTIGALSLWSEEKDRVSEKVLRMIYKIALENSEIGPDKNGQTYALFLTSFGKWSAWYDDPEDYGITTETMKRVRWNPLLWEDGEFAEERIYEGFWRTFDKGGFRSEEEFLRWKLQTRSFLYRKHRSCEVFYKDGRVCYGSILNYRFNIYNAVDRLQKIGASMSDLKGFERSLLKEELQNVQCFLNLKLEHTLWVKYKNNPRMIKIYKDEAENRVTDIKHLLLKKFITD